MERKNIELRIEGLREGKLLSPDLLDVDEMVNLLSCVRDFLYPEKVRDRLNKKQQVRIRIKKNLSTGEYGNKSAELVEFIDFDEPESPDSYLDRLINESSPYWEKVNDPESWLKHIRGYDR